MDVSQLSEWLKGGGFHLSQSLGIIGGLVFTALGFWRNTNVTRLAFRHQLMLSHRELWNRYTDSPELRRVLVRSADLEVQPISEPEHRFVVSLISHVEFVFLATQHGLYRVIPSDLLDIRQAFAYPVIRAVWQEVSPYRDKRFVRFMEKRVFSAGERSANQTDRQA